MAYLIHYMNVGSVPVKYSLARSKIIVDIDNYIISSGCYKKFINWLESLAVEQPLLPKDTDPWLHFEPSKKQYEKRTSHQKNQEKNMIDELVHYQSQTGYMKKCSVCQISNIDNKKWVCPTCYNKLPTISEINKQFDEPSNITNIIKKSININPYTFEEAQSVPESEVYILQLFVPDPIGVNPNSIANIRKVLEYIKVISRINDSNRKWFIVTCDRDRLSLAYINSGCSSQRDKHVKVIHRVKLRYRYERFHAMSRILE
ncbi:hypothetical protein Glove_624g6 [Diversispora epigaea]|uniref:Uncharacterized protein n=1 Tax=Diversispora epigaea TaxID=1348612 RepID=A0A397GE46_9GLOM|nr:hypothetical protein Glove_624g6 [Diversispora epigaea]